MALRVAESTAEQGISHGGCGRPLRILCDIAEGGQVWGGLEEHTCACWDATSPRLATCQSSCSGRTTRLRN
jgi:hypothetical protein